MVDKFNTYYNNLMLMKKADIIREGITWGFWTDTPGNIKELMTWKKVLLARSVADRAVRLELRGY